MQHTPYGYKIINGKPVIDEEKAGNIRKISENYLSGMSFVSAARDVGLTMSHCGVKRMLQNRRYLGDDFYPAILTEDVAKAIEEERCRREKALGRDGRKSKDAPQGKVYIGFSALKIEQKYKDPVRQAEYAYSRIRNEVDR